MSATEQFSLWTYIKALEGRVKELEKERINIKEAAVLKGENSERRNLQVS